jgi:lysozyme
MSLYRATPATSQFSQKHVNSSASPVPPDLRGIDVSGHHPSVDWAKVAASGIVLAYCKATEGLTYRSPLYFAQMNGARQAGLRVAAFHYFHPGDDPVQQAEFFLKAAGTNAAWLPHALDLEVTDGAPAPAVLAGAARWLEVVSAAIRQPAMIYVSPAFWRGLGDPRNFHQHPLWVADYAAQPSLPGGWPTYAMWQFTDAGTVDGIPGPVDLNAVDPDWFASVTGAV